MASAQAPTNPFDGFDAYTGVAAPPPQGSVAQQPPQQGMRPPQQQGGQQRGQWNQQPGQNPFAANQGALVPSALQSNPYALGMNQPQQQPQTQQGMMNQPLQGMNRPQMYPQQPQFPQQPPVQQQAMYPAQQQQMVHVGSGNAWAMPPTPVSAVNPMAPPATPAAANQQQLVTAPLSDDPFSIFASPAPQPPPPATPQHQIEQQMQSLQFSDNTPSKQSIMPDDDDEEGLALVDVELDQEETNINDKSSFEEHKHDGEFIGRNSDTKESKSPRRKDKNADIAPPPPMHPGRENAEYLSRNAGGMTSPLPRPALVVHSGYVLSRISFRTVLLRKWKQTFWIQYGPTQLLFFRSYSDFDDWLNNPYHTMKAREYLVKLRVDFVSDLKKKSVMGYQVTQIRRKPYGRNVMLHFKLERWMDYGPTIAAAFAARQEEMIESDYYKNNQNGKNRDEDGGMNTTNDVSALRKIILGCMRNARDAALLASQDRMSPRAQPEYQGRYAEDREVGGVERGGQDRNGQDRGSPEKFRMSNQSSKAGLYHQAFAAESSGRRKHQEDDAEESNSNDNQDSGSEAPAKEEAVTQIVDLLG